MDLQLDQLLKRYKKLLDSNDLLTNKFRVIFEKEYENLLRKYLNNPESTNLYNSSRSFVPEFK